jgi:cellobiose phosphorylase
VAREAGLAISAVNRILGRVGGDGAPLRNGRFVEEEPFRAELFSVNQLERHARSLAGWHEVGRVRGPDRLLPRLAANEVVMRQAYDLISDAVKKGRRITPAAEWFLDNYHLIEEQIRTSRRHLPRGYSRELPRLTNGASAGYPRVYDIVLELISHVDGRVDAESLRAFIAAYQSVTVLKLGELWAIPIMLRLALLENLRRVAMRVAAGRRDREKATYWVERMMEIGAREPGKVVLELAEMVKDDPPLSNAFAAEFAARLHGQGPVLVFPMTWLEQRLSEQGLTLEHVLQQTSQDQASDQVSIGNSITSLRFLGAVEWREFVERMSVVEQTLRTDPAGVYPRMDFVSRDRYRHCVEDIAKRSKLSEEQVATKVIELAHDGRGGNGAAVADERAGHVGYFLIGPGRDAAERQAEARPTMRRRVARLCRRLRLPLYIGLLTVTAALITALVLWWSALHGLGTWQLWTLGVAVAICASQASVALVHWAATLLVQPRLLPRMDFSAGIPPEHRTIVAVPAMLIDAKEVDELLEGLEVRFLANRDRNLLFALLSDFRDAPTETMPDDDPLLSQARAGIEALNHKYGITAPKDDGNGDGNGHDRPAPDETGGFFLFHRARQYNKSEGCWMGWERKRGKLEQFNATLRGAEGKFSIVLGPVERLDGIKYVITLDSDTQLPRDSARQLAGTMAHPLNRPRYDARRRRVTAGYTILQPRVGVSLPSAGRSRFSRLFAGDPGIDPYTRAVSDVYQDVFEEGSFIGKGIYDIDSFVQSAGGRFPENRVLSHDLLEGAHARSGLVSDVMLFEEFPAAFPADVSRRYRWIRGDWQITPWLLPRVPGTDARGAANPISHLSRWKILDNLRRSTVPPAMLALLLLGWFLPGQAGFYTAVVIGIMLLPVVLSGAVELARRPRELPVAQHIMFVMRSLGRQLMQELFALAILPYDAYLSLDAIGTTTWRLFITRRRLLQWRTSRDVQRSTRTDLAEFYRSMWVLPTLAIAAAVGVFYVHLQALHVAAPIMALWLISPLAAWWISHPVRTPRPRISEQDRQFLGVVARRTWRYFETFVVAADNFLPPDNFQEDPPVGAAHRTSPTNIGIAMLSNLAAFDFGYIPVGDLMQRTANTLATLDRMQRYRTHFYNWYDTRSLEPLRPLYVSTVDSGNLAGHLLTLAVGLAGLSGRKIFPRQMCSGLAATLTVLRDVASARGVAHDTTERLNRLAEQLRLEPPTLSAAFMLLQRVAGAAAELRLALDAVNDEELSWWAKAFEDQSRAQDQELRRCAPWVELAPPAQVMWRQGDGAQVSRLANLRDLMHRLDEAPTLGETARLEMTLLPSIDAILADESGSRGPTGQWMADLRAAIVAAAERASTRIIELEQLATRCREFADVDYSFLYDKDRRLLAIGFNAGEHQRDASFYDLLASESRLASFVAISQGKLPQEHWFSLGRLLTRSGGKTALLSWSGSMFEYLMPLLVMPTYEHTLLDETYRAVVERQIEYGRERGVAWGISESGYNKTDVQLNYQYHAFGVPGLGFKRGLAEDLVIAPYATAMALMIDPQHACQNLLRLRDENRLGAYGFYEAVDFNPSRVPRGESSVTVRSFMAHHQAMSLLSLLYVLRDRPMQRRFESEPAFRATELLLQERVPKTPSVFPHPAEVSQARGLPAEPQANLRVFDTPHTAVPEVHLLSNGRYHVAISAAGGGYSRWRDLSVTRWHEDPTRDCWGTFCYVRNQETGAFWSTVYQPTLRRADSYEALYSQGRAEFRRTDGDLDIYTEMSVSPEDDIELRRISLTNHGRVRLQIEVTSYAEVVIAPMTADAAHRAFSNLFVQTELVRGRQAILCTRRPRAQTERPPWMIHLMSVHGSTVGQTSYETDRAQFLGRGGTAADPAAMHRTNLGDSEGAVLDPIVAIRNVISIGPDETVRLHLVTGMAETRDAAMGLIEKYHDQRLARRVLELAWTHSQVVLRQLDVSESDTQLFGRLASSIIYTNPLLRAPGSVIARNRRGQSGLWGYGISGDLPIVLLRIGDQAQMNLVKQIVQAHAYWRVKGLAADLVIWNEDQSGYRQVLQELILGLIASRAEQNLLDRPGGVFLRRVEQMSEEDKVLMQTVARVIVSDTAGTLAEQLDRRSRAEVPVPRFRSIRVRRAQTPVAVEVTPRNLAGFNGFGGFTQDGREYVITASPTPAPWVNVLANRFFGTIVSDSGAAYTWCENAQTFRLTPWNNDAVSDGSGEAIYLRDEENGRCWSPTPWPARGSMPYVTRHGFGYTIFEYAEGGIATEMWTYVATDAPVKFIVLKVKNTSGRPRRISLTSYFEVVLGERRPGSMMHVVTEVDPKTGALLARNAYNGEFGERVVFLDTSEALRTVSGDRGEFLGRNGAHASPAAMGRSRLSGRVGAAMDPCAAMQVMFDLAEGQEREISFTFGCGRDLNDARNLIGRFRGTNNARAALEGVWGYWNHALGAVYVLTPDASLNYLANGWLLYQVLASRVWGRSGFYQSGGAFGFRDQLQDVMALMYTEPAILREQLVRSAGRQFREGDVQHWWHPPLGRGVRTRISDDYLWLPYAVCRYVAGIGDTGVLDERIHFLEGRPLNVDEDSYYDLPVRAEESATLYEHCVRAIRHGLRFGEHGLPLMGSGDWNDGMNLVGLHDKGESVWLGFFLHEVLRQFAEVARRRQDGEFADLCIAEAAKLRQNLDDHGWDGQWYRRAYFDNGEPLGSASNPECRIDSLPQSWAVLAGATDLVRGREALAQVDAQLVSRDLRLIKLFDPPFDTSNLNPGYVKGYPPGVRENGGQYTHAAVWAVMAFAAAGEVEKAWELLRMLNPASHGDSPAAIATYKVEPYVMAADIYTNPQHPGRGGWTWYTGSAGWMYRLVVESLLGLTLEVNRLRLSPRLPAAWKEMEIHYRYHETFHHIHIHNRGGKKVTRVTFDGAEQGDLSIPLLNDHREHRADVELG